MIVAIKLEIVHLQGGLLLGLIMLRVIQLKPKDIVLLNGERKENMAMNYMTISMIKKKIKI